MNKLTLYILNFTVVIVLGLMSFGFYISTYLALWDYPLVAITSAIWGSSSLICFIYLYSKLDTQSRENGNK